MRTGVFKRGVVSILLVFGLVFSMITFTPLASSGDWVNRPEPGGTTIEVVQGENFVIRHVLEWDESQDGAYTVTIAWDCYDNHENENFTFLSAEAYFDLDNDNLPDSGLDPILAVVTLDSAPSSDYPGSTRYALSVSCPADNRDNRNGQFNVDVWMGAYGAGGVPHIPTDNHPIPFQFAGVIITESGLDSWDRAPITIRVLPPVEWQLIEAWTGTIEAPAQWRPIETWTGTIRTIWWKLIETWTGIIGAPANWELIETWNGIVRAPAEWQLIETWDGAVESPAQWQLIEMWTGSIETHFAVEWQLVETWTGAVEAPGVWQLVETWTGTVKALAEWQLIETWAGTVKAHAEWQLIETWTGTIEAPLLGKPVLVSPENTTQTDNTPTFVWIIGSNADNHRLLVDDDSDFGSPADNVLMGATDYTWSKSASDYPEDNYYWKVIAFNEQGENESVAWSFEVDAQAPSAPTLVSPADAPVTGTTTDDTTPTFDWSDVTDPSGVTYTLKIGTLTKTGLTTSTYTLTSGEALSDGNYSWRVRAVDGASNAGDWSDAWTLTVVTVPSPPPPSPPITPPAPADTTPPSAPSLVSPANGESMTDNTPLLNWSDVSDPSGVTYDLAIARDAGFMSIGLEKTDLTTSAYELTPAEALSDDTYYWRARAVDGAGNISSWSEIWSFTVSVPPAPATLTVDIPSITPDENATIEVENTAITGMTIAVEENVENVRITVQQMTDKPAEIAIGAPGVTYTYLNIVCENITDADIEIVLIDFKVKKAWITAEDIDPDSIVMRRWDSVTEMWVSLPTTRIGDDDTYYYYYQAESPGLSIFGIGYALAPAPAEFQLSNLMIDLSLEGAVTISVVVANVSDIEGTCTVTLKINNIVETTENVTLAGGATETVTFTVSMDVEGTYDIEVDGLVGTFVVTSPAPPAIVPLAITGGIVLLAGILIWLRRRKT